MMYYDDLEYAQKRLSGTILFNNDNKLVVVQKVSVDSSDRPVALCEDVVTGESLSWVPLKSLDLTPINLGYFDYGETEAFFSARKPMRQDWRQGLSTKSFYVYQSHRPIAISAVAQPAYDMYDKTEKVLEKLFKSKHGVTRAMSRDFALQRDGTNINLFYRIYKVGEFRKDQFVLAPGKEFLKEHLQESVRK